MEKIFLVEDEVIVREGIKKNIDWEKHGYEFCGEARDGELAFPLIQKLKPDIVITDIKMPFMDGLELSRLIKQSQPETEIILLSGYQDFAYAQEGIKIGVVQYLTKPISGEELLAEVDKVAAKIREKKRDQELVEKYKSEMAEKQTNKQSALFQKLVSGKYTMAELVDESQRCELDISAVWYNILLFNARSKKEKREEYSDTLVRLADELDGICKRLGIVIFDRSLEGKALLFKADTVEELELKQSQMEQAICENLEQYKDIQYFGGFGEPVIRMTELSDCFEKAQRVFAHRFFENENKILHNDALVDSGVVEDEFNIGAVDNVDKSKIDSFLKTGTKEEVEYFVAEFTHSTGSNFLKSLMFRQYIVMDIYFSVTAFAESLNHSRDEIEAIDMNKATMVNPDDAKEYLIRILEQAIVIRESSATNRYKEVVDEVVQYIQDNYADEELCLNTLASHVNVSPNHLSMIFSQQKGVTLIKYLTDFRLGKAKELLRCTSMRSSEISEKVGYRDPHYFSYLFKKTLGMTPTQYRGNNE